MQLHLNPWTGSEAVRFLHIQLSLHVPQSIMSYHSAPPRSISSPIFFFICVAFFVFALISLSFIALCSSLFMHMRHKQSLWCDVKLNSVLPFFKHFYYTGDKRWLGKCEYGEKETKKCVCVSKLATRQGLKMQPKDAEAQRQKTTAYLCASFQVFKLIFFVEGSFEDFSVLPCNSVVLHINNQDLRLHRPGKAQILQCCSTENANIYFY